MKPIKYSLTKQIANELEEKIQSGQYNIGDKIPTEPELVDHFGVSRNTIRESVQALIHAGLLEARQGDGTYVVAMEKLQVELFTLMSKTEKQEIQEARNLLEEYIDTLHKDLFTAIKNKDIKKSKETILRIMDL